MSWCCCDTRTTKKSASRWQNLAKRTRISSINLPACAEEEKPIAGDGAAPKKAEARKRLTKEEIQQAEAVVNDLFKDDVANARTPQQKVALADKLLTTAKAEQERANRYALLKKAAELAASVGNTKLTLHNLDLLDEIQFSPDVWVENLSILASKKPDDVGAVFDKVDALIRKCYTLDDYDSAKKLAGLLPTFAKIAKSPDFQNRAKARVSEVSECRRRFQEARRCGSGGAGENTQRPGRKLDGRQIPLLRQDGLGPRSPDARVGF